MTLNGSRRFFVVATTLAVVAVAGLAIAQQSALNHPARTDDERARDAGTKPLELYAFFDVEAGDTVADLIPGGGYNTIVLAGVVGSNGRVYSGPDGRGRVAPRVGDMSNVTVFSDFGAIPAGSLDVAITVRNMHDLIGRNNHEGALAAIMTALKSGGTLGVVDARTTRDGYDDDTHRINQQLVIDTVTAAGFEFVESSEMLANPDDDVSSYAEGGDRYDIDRMTLKFRKPGN